MGSVGSADLVDSVVLVDLVATQVKEVLVDSEDSVDLEGTLVASEDSVATWVDSEVEIWVDLEVAIWAVLLEAIWAAIWAVTPV